MTEAVKIMLITLPFKMKDSSMGFESLHFTLTLHGVRLWPKGDSLSAAGDKLAGIYDSSSWFYDNSSCFYDNPSWFYDNSSWFYDNLACFYDRHIRLHKRTVSSLLINYKSIN